jgi:hypothetical protein
VVVNPLLRQRAEDATTLRESVRSQLRKDIAVDAFGRAQRRTVLVQVVVDGFLRPLALLSITS